MSIQIKKPFRLLPVLVTIAALLLIVIRPANAQVLKKPESARMDTTLSIPLKLKQVDVKGMRNTRLDSVFNRKQFAAVFKHKDPGFSSLFSQKVSFSNQYSPFQSSTSSIVGVNLLALPGLLGKKRSPTNKLKEKLLKEEEAGFVDRAFSKNLISSVTNLQDDSLQLFRERYLPSYTFAKQTSAYDMILYIKKSMQEFKQAKTEKIN